MSLGHKAGNSERGDAFDCVKRDSAREWVAGVREPARKSSHHPHAQAPPVAPRGKDPRVEPPLQKRHWLLEVSCSTFPLLFGSAC